MSILFDIVAEYLELYFFVCGLGRVAGNHGEQSLSYIYLVFSKTFLYSLELFLAFVFLKFRNFYLGVEPLRPLYTLGEWALVPFYINGSFKFNKRCISSCQENGLFNITM